MASIPHATSYPPFRFKSHCLTTKTHDTWQSPRYPLYPRMCFLNFKSDCSLSLSFPNPPLHLSHIHTLLSFPPSFLMCICACMCVFSFSRKDCQKPQTTSGSCLEEIPRRGISWVQLSSWCKTSCIINHIPEVHIDKTKAIPKAPFFLSNKQIIE